jgi:hypothetical protein
LPVPPAPPVVAPPVVGFPGGGLAPGGLTPPVGAPPVVTLEPPIPVVPLLPLLVCVGILLMDSVFCGCFEFFDFVKGLPQLGPCVGDLL